LISLTILKVSQLSLSFSSNRYEQIVNI